MRKLFTQMTIKPSDGEIMSPEILTVPDQTLSIRQILDMYTRGVPVNSSHREPIFNEDFEHNSPAHYDLAEIDDMHEEYKETQREAKERLKQIEARKKELEKLKPTENE